MFAIGVGSEPLMKPDFRGSDPPVKWRNRQQRTGRNGPFPRKKTGASSLGGSGGNRSHGPSPAPPAYEQSAQDCGAQEPTREDQRGFESGSRPSHFRKLEDSNGHQPARFHPRAAPARFRRRLIGELVRWISTGCVAIRHTSLISKRSHRQVEPEVPACERFYRALTGRLRNSSSQRSPEPRRHCRSRVTPGEGPRKGGSLRSGSHGVSRLDDGWETAGAKRERIRSLIASDPGRGP